METISLTTCRHFARFVFTFTLFLCNPCVYSQTVTMITSSTLTPNLGTNSYVLECNILNFEHQAGRSLAWTKDEVLVGWNRNVIDFNGWIQETGGFPNPITLYSLFISEVDSSHGGVYKCLIVDGQQSDYVEVGSAQVTVQVPYFPPGDYPMCSPSVPTIGVVGTQLSLSCTSLPGIPDEVNLFLQRSGQHLSSGKKTNNILQVDYMHTVSADDSAASFTCVIVGTGQYTGRSSSCNIGPLTIIPSAPQVTPNPLSVTVGKDAIFTCELSSADTFEWSTNPMTSLLSRIISGNTLTLLDVQLSDNNKIVVCKVTINGANIEGRAQLMVITGTVEPVPPQGTTNAPQTTSKSTQNANQPVVTDENGNPDPTPNQMITSNSGSNGQSAGTVLPTNKSDSTVTSLSSTSNEQVLIIIIAAVGGLVFILIIVVIIACVCCYRLKPKPIVVADGDSFDGSEISWEARADGAMTRRSHIQYHTEEPPPRRPEPESNKGFENERSKHHHLLKIPDGLSTVTSGTMSVSPSLAYAMEYLNSPNDPMREDDMSSVAQTYDSRNYLGGSNQGPLETGFTGDLNLYSQGTTNFGGPPSFDPRLPGGHDYEESEVSDTGTFIKRGIYDSVYSDSKDSKEQEPDMPTYALPHRDRISKNNSNKNALHNPYSEQYPDVQNIDRNVKRNPSLPYVNTAYGHDSGMVPNTIYQSVEPPMDDHNDKQFY